jgi:hypothetical protein
MVPKSDLRHNSFYLYKDKLYKHDTDNPFKFPYSTNNYYIDLQPISFTKEVFNLVKEQLRPIFDQSWTSGEVSVRLFKFPSENHYWLVFNEIKVSEVKFLHSLQNLLHELYDKELEINDEQLLKVAKPYYLYK